MMKRLGLTLGLLAISSFVSAETTTQTSTTVKPGLTNDVSEPVTMTSTQSQTTITDSTTTNPIVTQSATTTISTTTPTTQVTTKAETNLVDEAETGPLRHGILSLTLGLGYDFFAQKRQLNNTSVPFVALGYDFTKHWGVEMFYGVFNTDSQNVSAGKPYVHGAIFAFDGVYRLNPYKTMVPYLLFGVGVIGLSYNNNDADNQGNINAGLGLQFFTSDNINLRLEGRDFYTTVGGKNDIMFNLGVSFLMDIG